MFSIIIPARLDSQILKNTLENCLEQSYTNFEIIVILDLESDNLIVNEKIRYIFSGIKSPGEKRNLGINQAKGHYIAFLDDDAYPDIDWLKNAYELLEQNKDFIGVCGPSITPQSSDFLEKIGGYIFESFLTSGPTRYRHLASKHRFVDDYPTVNLILRKDILNQIGGFDNNFWPGEDTKLCHDLVLKFGKKIYYSPLLVVFHKRRTIFHPHLIQVSRYASHRGFFAKKFPKTSLKLSYFIPSFFVIYLISLLFSTIGGFKFTNWLILPMFLYLILILFDFINVYFKSSSFAAGILTIIGIFLSNLTYGLFFIKGILSKPELVLREVDIINEEYLKG
jgi:glycosyltransferase involved in cell wall biosynthesis